MRSILFAVGSLLLVTASCRDVDQDNRAPFSSKPIERAPTTADDHEYVRVRSSFEQHARERLAKLDQRIAALEKSGGESAHETVLELRRDRDELSARIDRISQQAKPQWDEFQSRVEDGFQRLEKRVDDLLP